MRIISTLLVGSLMVSSGCVAHSIKEQKVRSAMDELWVEKNLDNIEAYYTAEAAEEVEQFMRESLAVWPDPKVEINTIAIDAETLVVEWTVTGKHRDLGKEVTLRGVNIATIDGFKVSSERRYFDNLAVMDQLGYRIIPPGMKVEGEDSAPKILLGEEDEEDSEKEVPDAPVPEEPDAEDGVDEGADPADKAAEEAPAPAP